MSEALPQFGDDWRRRWLVLPSWNRLHRVAEIRWEDDDGEDGPRGSGHTVCGLGGDLAIPGIFSRLNLPRCKHCCRILGIPDGDGAPANQHIEEP